MIDDLASMARQDREGMLPATVRFPEQWREARTGDLPDLSSLPRDPEQVLFTGMGGSGTGGEFACMLLDREDGPVGRVVHDYDVPSWVDERTLVAATSYSGGTEETLTGVMQARERKAPWFAVTTGGALGEAARRHGAPHLRVPEGLQPRAAFGYLTVGLLRILCELGLLDKRSLEAAFERAEKGLVNVREECGPDAPIEKNPAKRLAQELSGRPVLVVADAPWEPVAQRVRCQFNENSKALSFTRVLPEANHNDTVAWSRAKNVEDWAVLFLGPFDRNRPIEQRAQFLRETWRERGVTVHALDDPEETDPVARMFLAEYRAAWVSVYLGFLNGVDPGEVDVIHTLKKRVGDTGHVDFVRKQLGV